MAGLIESPPIFYSPESGFQPPAVEIGDESPCKLDPCLLLRLLWILHGEFYGDLFKEIIPPRRPWDWKYDIEVKDLGGDTRSEVQKAGGFWHIRERAGIVIDCHLSPGDAVDELMRVILEGDLYKQEVRDFYSDAVQDPKKGERAWEEYEKRRDDLRKEFLGTAADLAEMSLSLVPGSGADVAFFLDDVGKGKWGSVAIDLFPKVFKALKKAGALKKVRGKLTIVTRAGKMSVNMSKVRGPIDIHHPIPKFLGGLAEQSSFSKLPRTKHQEFHQNLREALRNAGLPEDMPAFGGPGGSRERWRDYFQAAQDEGAQESALLALLKTCDEFDGQEGTNLLEDFTRNFLGGEFEMFPCPGMGK